MSLSRMVQGRTIWIGGLVLSALWWLASPASAQGPRYSRIPADAKGAQVVLFQQDLMQNRYASKTNGSPRTDFLPHPVGPAASKARPTPSGPPQYVAIRGPDGRVRSFVIRGGKEAIRIREEPK